MIPWLLSLYLAVAPGTPTAPNELRTAFLAGDLVTWSRGRTAWAEAGRDVTVGEMGLLHDLALLGLCRPIGPIPTYEAPEWIGPRLLIRLERVRLERMLRDGAYQNTPLRVLALGESVFQTKRADQEALLVRWPVESERWPDEVPEAPLLPSTCPSAPGAWKESGAGVWKARQRQRVLAERALYQALLPHLQAVPPELAAQVVLAHLAAQGPNFTAAAPEAGAWAPVLRGGRPGIRSAGLLALARAVELGGERALAESLYQEVLASPERTTAEDSRARVRLVAALEPRWSELIAVVDGAEAPRPEDRPILDNAKARALYAQGELQALQTFGRRFLDRPRTDTAHDAQTEDLLLRLSLKLPVAEALAWAEELARGLDAPARAALLESLGDQALSARNLDLATAIFDRLRLEARLETERRGPKAAASAARVLVARALVEVERDDVAAFAGLIEELVEQARAEEARPLARHAPHKELARLDQLLIPRLHGEVAGAPGRRAFAGALLEATTTLAPTGGRWRSILETYQSPLADLAGPYARGREAPKKPGSAKPKVVRQLGEVVIPRLPPALAAPDTPTDLPAITSFFVSPGPDGRLRPGPPWQDR